MRAMDNKGGRLCLVTGTGEVCIFLYKNHETDESQRAADGHR